MEIYEYMTIVWIVTVVVFTTVAIVLYLKYKPKKKGKITKKHKTHKVKQFFKKYWTTICNIIVAIWKFFTEKAKKTDKITKFSAGFIIAVIIVLGFGFDCQYKDGKIDYIRCNWAAPDPDDVNKIVPLDFDASSVDIQHKGTKR